MTANAEKSELPVRVSMAYNAVLGAPFIKDKSRFRDVIRVLAMSVFS